MRFQLQNTQSEDEPSQSQNPDVPKTSHTQTRPIIENSIKENTLTTLDQKYKQLSAFIQKLPLKLKGPVQIGTCHEDIQVPQLEQTVSSERLLQLTGNTIRKMKNHKRLKKNWNKQDLTILLWVADKYNHLQNKNVSAYKQEDWQNISKLIPGKTGSECMFKWLSLRKHHLTDHPWTLDQEMDLKKLVEQKGQSSWPQISQSLYLVGQTLRIFRSAKQCREHWTCYVNPNLKKGLWKPQQDLQLLNQFIKLGKKWAEISKVLNGRTENAIKNRFNLLMQKEGSTQDGSNLNNRKDYALRIIQQIQAVQATKPKHQECADSLKKNELMGLGQVRQSIYNDQLQNQFKFFSEELVATNNEISQLQVKVQSHQQSIVKRVKFCKVSLQGLMEMEGVIPAIFDRETMQIFIDNNC